MTTSVPSVISIKDLKWRIANLMEGAAEVYRTSGEVELLAKTVQLARDLFEELKLEAHKGRVSWDYIKRCTASLDRLDDFILKVRARAKATK